MRERQFWIKYRYQRSKEDERVDPSQEWFAINVSDQINSGAIYFLDLESIIELLKLDNATFNEKNIKIMEGMYWVAIGD